MQHNAILKVDMIDNNAKEQLSPVKILAVDLDDTLLTEDLTISEPNRKALKRAEDAGVTVLLATGRVPESIYRFTAELGMTNREGYLITGNGTLLTRSDTGEEIFRITLPVKDAVAAFRYLDSKEIPAMVYHGEAIYASRENQWIDEDCRLSGLRKVIIKDYERFLKENPQLKILIPGDPEEIARLEVILKKQLGHRFHIIISKPFFLELLPPDADKGKALEFLANKLNVPSAQVMAIGDSMNDLGMIEYAGIGIAVGNAVLKIKDAANYVIDKTHNEDAVAEAVRLFIFNSKND